MILFLRELKILNDTVDKKIAIPFIWIEEVLQLIAKHYKNYSKSIPILNLFSIKVKLIFNYIIKE